MSEQATAAIIVIGNEVLSGKVVESNARFLVEELRELGVPLKRISVIPDEIDTIAEIVRDHSRRFTHVFTSGGVGPTHDDVTIAAIARAFDRPLVHNATFAHALAKVYGDKLNDNVLVMANLPDNCTLLEVEQLRMPVLSVGNVYVLPGEPTLFKRKFLAIRERFRQSPFHLRKVYSKLDEGDIATLLAEVEKRHPGVSVGSYPNYHNPDYIVMITIESKAAELVEQALAMTLAGIPKEQIFKVE